MRQDLRPSPITATVDFDADGVQHGFLRLPYSRDDAAWGSVMIPLTVVRNGTGPTALLTGANHGDEYEGPIALFDLARTLRAAEVTGRVIIVPAMNQPAFAGGTRTSPIDRGNLHRSFPGQVLDLELEHEQGRWIYEIKLLQPDGQLLKLEVDARTAQVLQVKRKDDRKARYRPQP